MQSHTNLQAAGNPIGWALSWSHDEVQDGSGHASSMFLRACADAYAAAADVRRAVQAVKEPSSSAAAYRAEIFPSTS